jgi:ribosomal-protein-serine acetyltransferase
MVTRKIYAHLEVRLLTPQDAEALFHLIDANRQHLRPWFEMPEITEQVSDTANWIQSMLARRQKSPGGWSGIFSDGKLVGAIGVTTFEQHHATVEIGYYLASDACGQGIATRACAAMLGHLFGDLRLHRVGLRIASTNQRSIRLAERLGFKLEGRLREAEVFDETRRDLLIFGMLASEWNSSSL